MKRLILVLATLLFLVSFAQVGFAEDNFIVTPESSSVFVSTVSDIFLVSGQIGSQAESWLVAPMSQSITMELQKWDGFKWLTINSWSSSGSNSFLRIIKYTPVTSGLFRVKSTHNAGGETRISYSQEQFFQ